MATTIDNTDEPKYRILELASDGFDVADIYERLNGDYDWMTPQYVDFVIENFDTEDDILASISRDTVDTDQDVVEYECEKCGKRFGKIGSARIHAAKSNGHDEYDIAILGAPEVADHHTSTGLPVMSPQEFEIFRTVAEHPNWSQRQVAREVGGINQRIVSQLYDRFDLDWANRGIFVDPDRAADYVDTGEPDELAVDSDDEVVATEEPPTDEPIRLSDDATDDDLQLGQRYHAIVNGRQDYGIFVSLNDGWPDVSGLAHRSKIKNGVPGDYEPGEPVVVTYIGRHGDGPSFCDVRKTEFGDAYVDPPAVKTPAEPEPDESPATEPEWNTASASLKALIYNIVSAWPDYRATGHVTQNDRRVLLIEYADENGNYETGLPSDFVELISNRGR